MGPCSSSRRAKGARVRDADGKGYIDYVGSWGPMILGHAYGPIVEAVREAALDGFALGATSPREIELGERIRAAMPSMERMRFTSSGTEAVMSALRLARGFTGRSKILKFAGCYHGHADSLLVEAGSGVATLGMPASAGRDRGPGGRHARRRPTTTSRPSRTSSRSTAATSRR